MENHLEDESVAGLWGSSWTSHCRSVGSTTVAGLLDRIKRTKRAEGPHTSLSFLTVCAIWPDVDQNVIYQTSSAGLRHISQERTEGLWPLGLTWRAGKAVSTSRPTHHNEGHSSTRPRGHLREALTSCYWHLTAFTTAWGVSIYIHKKVIQITDINQT